MKLARAIVLGVVLAGAGACAGAGARAGARAGAGAGSETGASDAGEDSDGDAAAGADADTAVAEADDGDASPSPSFLCPADMALVASADGRVRACVDKYEASLVEVLADGTEQPYPHYLPVDGHVVRAVSREGVFPQGYISEVQADDACQASGKHLCTADEWKTACMGPARTTFPYGDTRRPGVCHDTGKSAVGAVFGAKALAASSPAPSGKPTKTASSGSKSSKGSKPANVTKGRAAQVTKARATSASASSGGGSKKTTKRPAPGKKSARPASVEPSVWTRLNDPALGQVEGALAKTGDHPECVNAFGVFDMVGNLHEWVATDPAVSHGTFAGGYYLDTALNGDGCLYRTIAHAHDYHDYSTGFRCCKEAPQR